MRLFVEQDGKCCYCQEYMILFRDVDCQLQGKQPDLYATFEHLDHRFSNLRGAFQNTNIRRIALACYKCNSKKGKEDFINHKKGLTIENNTSINGNMKVEIDGIQVDVFPVEGEKTLFRLEAPDGYRFASDLSNTEYTDSLHDLSNVKLLKVNLVENVDREERKVSQV